MAAETRFSKAMMEIERRLQEERVAAETLIRTLTERQNGVLEKTERRTKELEEELAQARKIGVEQREIAERVIVQLAAERDGSQSELNKAKTTVEKLGAELANVQERLGIQNESAGRLLRQLEAERDAVRAEFQDLRKKYQEQEAELDRTRVERESLRARCNELQEELSQTRNLLTEAEKSAQDLQEEFVLSDRVFQEQMRRAEELIGQLQASRDESRIRLDEAETHARKSEEELAASREWIQREQSTSVKSPILLLLGVSDLLAANLPSNAALQELAQEIRAQCRRFLDGLETKDCVATQ